MRTSRSLLTGLAAAGLLVLALTLGLVMISLGTAHAAADTCRAHAVQLCER